MVLMTFKLDIYSLKNKIFLILSLNVVTMQLSLNFDRSYQHFAEHIIFAVVIYFVYIVFTVS